MLTPLQVGQFRAMGFLKLEACLTLDETAQFEAAYNRLIAGASAYDYFENNLGRPGRGTRHQNRCAELDDDFASFVEHPRIF